MMKVSGAWTSVVLVPNGGGGYAAVCARVRRGVGGATVERLGVVEDVSSAGEGALREAMGGGGRGRLVVTLAGGQCVVRPIGLDAAGFGAARDELLRASEELFPFAGEDALLGYVGGVAADGDGGGRGWLVGAQRSRVEGVLGPIEAAFGHAASVVMAPQQAMLGLGVAGEEGGDAVVAERTVLGSRVEHVLRCGVPIAMARPAAGDVEHADAALPSSWPTDAEAAWSLGVGAVVSLDAAREQVRPMRGRSALSAMRFAGPAAMLAAAVAIAFLAFWLSDRRYAAAADALVDRQAAMSAEAEATREALAELGELTARLRAVEGLVVGEGRGMLETVWAVHAVLPERAFFTRVAVRPESVTVEGAAARAQAVLRGLESSDAFTAAVENASYARFGLGLGEVAEYETFDLTARRTDAGPRGERGGGS